MIDTHCHLDMLDADEEQVLTRAREAGIEAVITISSDYPSNRKNIAMADRHRDVYASVGLHPHDASDFTDAVEKEIRQWSLEAKVVAIGETGLDYHYDRSPREVQRAVFRRQLALARDTGLPVIIHSREAADDTFSLLTESGVRNGVFHCFSGDRAMAERALALGFFISFAGPVTFRKADNLREVAAMVPDERLLVETDAPYLAPEPLRGRRNEPAFLHHTIRKIAGVRRVEPEDISRMTAVNARRLFALGGLPGQGEIAYRIRNSLYLNITNRCTNACSFCIRFQSDYVKGHRLSLSAEPSEEQMKAAIGDPSAYQEIVFCGYGEPLLRLDLVKDLARWIHEQGGRVRINTNGHACLIHKRNILPELSGLIDAVSVSLDAQDEETYNRICNPAFANAFEAVLSFLGEARHFIPEVQATVVETEGVDIRKCGDLTAKLGVALRVRRRDVVG
jgi:TatD DNase family protein